MKTPRRKKAKLKYTVKFKHLAAGPPFGMEFLESKKTARKKVNFMVDLNILEGMKFFVPAGERSDFVNKALQASLKDFARKKASEAMDEIRKKWNLKITNEEIRKYREYGRE